MDTNITHTLDDTSESQTIILQPGQSFALDGIMGEIDVVSADCGTPPYYIPSGLIDHNTPQCIGRVNKIFNYSDFVGGTGSQLVTDASAASCKFELQYSITVQ